jgi:hypothetical protein
MQSSLLFNLEIIGDIIGVFSSFPGLFRKAKLTDFILDAALNVPLTDNTAVQKLLAGNIKPIIFASGVKTHSDKHPVNIFLEVVCEYCY